MKCSFNTNPFKYGTIHQLLTKEENDILYDACNEFYKKNKESIDDLSFFVLETDRDEYKKIGKHRALNSGLHQNNAGIYNLENIFTDTNKNDVFSKLMYSLPKKFNADDILESFPKKFNENGKPMEYSCGLTITADLPHSPLRPHNDNPIELMQYGKDNNIHVSTGFYKGVIYITNDNLDYTDYGTRFYNKISKTKELFTEIEEVKFRGGDACIFEAGPDSYHGTDFKKGLPHNRYTITFEYY